MNRFLLPLVIKCHQEAGADLLQTSLQGAHLSRSKAPRIEALQLLEEVDARAFGVDQQPGRDLLPHALKGVWTGAPVMGRPLF